MNCKTTNQFPPKRHICYGVKMLLSVFLLFYLSAAQAQISGTKTVCASGCDYNTIDKAVSDLKTKGINGKTTIEISTGQYNESVSISGISGLSSANTLTFKGMGSAPTDVHVYSTNNYVFQLSSVSYVTLDNIYIEQQTLGTNCGVDVYASKNCTIQNCWVWAPVNNSYYFGCAATRTGASTDILWKKNRLRGGGYMVCDEGYSNGSNTRTVYDGNTITKGYNYTIMAYKNTDNQYINNYMDSGQQSSSTGLYCNYETNAKISANYFGPVNSNYGLGLFYVYGKIEIANNIVKCGANTTYGANIYIFVPQADVKFYYNTIHSSYKNGDLAYIINNYKGKVDFRNNNLTRDSSGTTLYYVGRTSKDIFEGNNYYNTSGTLLFLDASYAGLAAYKSALKSANVGQSDQSMAVKYKSSTDLHIDQSTKMPYGRNIGINTDVDGDTRCNYFVTSGADESNYSGNAHYTKPNAPKFTYPTTVYAGNPTIFSNSGNPGDPILYKWYIDGKLISDSFDLETYDLKSPGSKVKLVAYNCGGKDSAEVTVAVSTPSNAPVAEFIADATSVLQGDVVSFSDLSTNYPNSWKYEISPAYKFINGIKTPTYDVVYSSLTKANPHVKFNLPGNYKICLTAGNAKGSSSAECKTDYIEVISATNMPVSGTVNITQASGYLFDNGGPNDKPNGIYIQNKAIISGCNDSVFLIFKKFDLSCGGDYIRVFEGTDANGRSLNKCSTASNAGSYFGNVKGYVGGKTASTTGCTAASCTPAITDTFKAKQSMYIEMGLYGYNTTPGFEAYYWTKPNHDKAAVAKFLVEDSICTNQAFTLNNTSSGSNVKYLWDFDGDLSEFESIEKNPQWFYYTDGAYKITLITENCGGIDTFSKTIIVHNPATPGVFFSADNTNPTTTDIVFFTPEIKQCVDNYKWTFTAASGNGKAIFVNGTKNTSVNPQVNFTDTGCYTATLYVENISGSNSLTLSCYVNVKKPYCIPAVNTLNADIGISKVSFNTINNATSQSVSAYNNYVPDIVNSTKIEEGITYNLTVERKTNKNKATRTVWIDWNLDGDFNDTLEQVAQEINTTNLSWSTNIKMPDIAQYGASVMRIGIDLGTQKASPCGTNQTGEFEDYRVYLGAYKTLPIISLIGSDTITLQRGYKYSEPGAKAESLRFGDISSSVVIKKPASNFNQIPGNYYFYYDVTDSLGNKAKTVIRLVKIVADTTAPELIVDTPNTIFVQVYNAFQIPAILKAIDLADSNRVDTTITSNTDISKIGFYTITYTITDRSGNKAVAERYVIVGDTILPVLTLIGQDTVIHQVGAMYSDSGFTVKDNYYSEADLRANLLVKNNVDVMLIGDYTVDYILTDPYTGKKIEVIRVVLVRDTEKPVIKLMDSTVTLDVLTVFKDLGITITDNYDNNPVIKKEGSFYAKFPNGKATELGTYDVIYVVTDASGNTAKGTRVILVVDREAPKVILRDAPIQYVCRWGNYTDAGFDVTDNFYDVKDLVVNVSGNFLEDSTKLEGIYSLIYKVTDKSGNTGSSAYRFINVLNPYESPCSTKTSIGAEIALEKLVKIFPNPNTGKFTVETNLAEQVKINVTNVLGKEVAVNYLTSLSLNALQLDISACKPGVYLVNISTKTQTITKRIVVAK